MSKIEWTEKTWNPLIGCSKVSPGCKNCYAIQTAWIRMHNPKMAERYTGVVEKTPGGALNWTGKVNVVKEALEKPLHKKKPTMYFVNSMSDLFHEAVPFEVIDQIFAVMALCPHHTFQVLTKRPARMVEYFERHYAARIMTEIDHMGDLNDQLFDKCCIAAARIGMALEPIFPNIWLGVSVENQHTANERIPLLLKVPAAVRFLSCEPLIGPVDLRNIQGPVNRYQVLEPITMSGDSNRPAIDWVIVGGESGKDSRPMHTQWARNLRDQCQKAGVAYFFKQHGEWVECGQEPGFIPGSKVRKVINILTDGSVYTTGVIRAGDLACMKKVGKDKSGRLLDGREWNEFPTSGKCSAPADDPELHTGGFDY